MDGMSVLIWTALIVLAAIGIRRIRRWLDGKGGARKAARYVAAMSVNHNLAQKKG